MPAERSGTRHLERPAKRPGPERLLALHLVREPADGCVARQALAGPPDRDAPHDGNGKPEEERNHTGEIDPTRPAERDHARGEQERCEANGRCTTGRCDQARQPTALAIDEIGDRHAVGRLVTA